MFVPASQALSQEDLTLSVFCCDWQLSTVHSYKYLGVVLDSKLTRAPHRTRAPSRPFLEQTLPEHSGVFVGRVAKRVLTYNTRTVQAYCWSGNQGCRVHQVQLVNDSGQMHCSAVAVDDPGQNHCSAVSVASWFPLAFFQFEISTLSNRSSVHSSSIAR